MNRRRILIIAGIAAIVAVLGIGAYILLKNRAASSDTSGNLPSIGGNFADITANPTDIVSSTIQLDPVIAYHVYPDGSVVGVHRDGKITRIKDAIRAALSSSAVSDIASASFSADGSKILVLTGREPRSQVNIFDVNTASWRVIPGSFRDAVWGPRGTLLATLTPDQKTGKTAIGLYDTNTGRTTQTIVSLALGDVSISWPSSGTLIVSDKPNAFSTGNAWAIDIATKRMTLVGRGKEGFDAVWDNTATQAVALEAKFPGRGGVMSIIRNTVPVAKLAFTTLPEKCTFTNLAGAGSSTTPYMVCAVPRDQDALQRYQLPDAWLRREIMTDDVIVGVNMDSRQVGFTIAPPLTIDATNIQVSGNTVYYTDRISDKLYKSSI